MKRPVLNRWLPPLAAAFVALVALGPRPARALPGFYAGSTGDKLAAPLTHVVLVRQGSRLVVTVLPTYEGPPKPFALVIPVPAGLTRDDVKVLPVDTLAHVDRLTAPRLQELWEQDPCADAADASAGHAGGRPPRGEEDLARVDERFAAGEYDVSLVAAAEPPSLDGALHRLGLHLPDGAEAALRPYTKAGARFLVAKVDPAKVRFEGARAHLSPLRFACETNELSLPLRLGLLSSPGTQEVVVSVLARSQRYEAANLPNVLVPTNLPLQPASAGDFRRIYAALFDAEQKATPGAVVTEFAGPASSCEVCPAPPLDAEDLVALGADLRPGAAADPAGDASPAGPPSPGRVTVYPTYDPLTDAGLAALRPALQRCYDAQQGPPSGGVARVGLDLDGRGGVSAAKVVAAPASLPKALLECAVERLREGRVPRTSGGGPVVVTLAFDLAPAAPLPPATGAASASGSATARPAARSSPALGWVLTRLHLRYASDAPLQDLTLRPARAIVGGREAWRAGALEQGAAPSDLNAFQARYVVRHPWTGAMTCASPARGSWGPPPGGVAPAPRVASADPRAPRTGVELRAVLGQDVPDLGLVATTPLVFPAPTAAPARKASAPPAASTPAAAGEGPPVATSGCACSAGAEAPSGLGLAAATALALAGLLTRRRSSVAFRALRA